MWFWILLPLLVADFFSPAWQNASNHRVHFMHEFSVCVFFSPQFCRRKMWFFCWPHVMHRKKWTQNPFVYVFDLVWIKIDRRHIKYLTWIVSMRLHSTHNFCFLLLLFSCLSHTQSHHHHRWIDQQHTDWKLQQKKVTNNIPIWLKTGKHTYTACLLWYLHFQCASQHLPTRSIKHTRKQYWWQNEREKKNAFIYLYTYALHNAQKAHTNSTGSNSNNSNNNNTHKKRTTAAQSAQK